MKTEQLQIRVTKEQKASLQRAARLANTSISQFVLARALGQTGARFDQLVSELKESNGSREILAEVNDLLKSLTASEFSESLPEPGVELSPFLRNYLAAMIEHSAAQHHCPPPDWIHRVKPLDQPFFGTDIKSLRGYLLVNSPIEFKKRNIFIDSTVGNRV